MRDQLQVTYGYPVLTGEVFTGNLIQAGLAVLILIMFCYAAGRLHQWVRQSLDRDQAYREGYDTATKSMFFLATRVSAKLNKEAPLPMTREMPAQLNRASAPDFNTQPRQPPLPPVVPPHRPVADGRKRRGARHAA